MEYSVSQFLLLGALTFIFVGAITPLMRKIAISVGAVDAPNLARKSQKEPVPYLGGVAIAIGVVGASYGSLLAVDFSMETFRLASFVLVPAMAISLMGLIDDLKGLGKAAHDRDIWFHVDGAYGLAALCAPSVRADFDGIEMADSFIVDPHKWLFAPYDACALVYRDPSFAKASHTQRGEYLETLNESGLWNPSDYSFGLTRRTRGLPLWFSLATHGAQKYREAIEESINVAHQAADLIRGLDYLELVREPELSVVVFERKGWGLADYDSWSEKLLKDEIGFVVSSSHQGKPNTRFAIVNPLTSIELLSKILESMN